MNFNRVFKFSVIFTIHFGVAVFLVQHPFNTYLTAWPLVVGNVGPSTFTARDSLGMKLPENSLRVGPASLIDFNRKLVGFLEIA